jgi:hypothetical protein
MATMALSTLVIRTADGHIDSVGSCSSNSISEIHSCGVAGIDRTFGFDSLTVGSVVHSVAYW